MALKPLCPGGKPTHGSSQEAKKKRRRASTRCSFLDCCVYTCGKQTQISRKQLEIASGRDFEINEGGTALRGYVTEGFFFFSVWFNQVPVNVFV